MRPLVLLLLAGAVLAQAPSYQPVASVAQIMLAMSYPASDAIFYVERNPPKNDSDWEMLARQGLVVAESGNLLMMPGRARDQGKWMEDAKLMVEAGAAAFKAARMKDLQAVLALNGQLEASCVTCHQDYRPNYRKRRQPPAKQE